MTEDAKTLSWPNATTPGAVIKICGHEIRLLVDPALDTNTAFLVSDGFYEMKDGKEEWHPERAVMLKWLA